MDDDIEKEWCSERRLKVLQYLRNQGLERAHVGEWPAWHVAPVVSVWAVESLKAPGSVGWWVISGDLPTDYCSAANCRHPRLAAKKIAESWLNIVKNDDPNAEMIGSTGISKALISNFVERANFILELVNDADLWPE